MRFETTTSPHKAAGTKVSSVMRQVLYALVPGIAVATYYFGPGVLIQIMLASVTALITEAAILRWRKRAVGRYLTDYSALVTAWLLALSIPSIAPWWLVVIGTAFSISFSKQLYGGIGYNPFNPAMVGYVVLLISFPVEMSQWPATNPALGTQLSMVDTLLIVFQPDTIQQWDAITAATPLDTIRSELLSGNNLNTAEQALAAPGIISAQGWEAVAVAYLLGGLWLWYRQVITWHIPFSLLGGLFVMAMLFSEINTDQYPSAWFHLFSGGAMLGAFFIATDPVSAATSNKGKVIYAAGIGVLIYIIRTWGSYPDAVAFAVLLMNLCAPYIDYYTQPRVFGAQT